VLYVPFVLYVPEELPTNVFVEAIGVLTLPAEMVLEMVLLLVVVEAAMPVGAAKLLKLLVTVVAPVAEALLLGTEATERLLTVVAPCVLALAGDIRQESASDTSFVPPRSSLSNHPLLLAARPIMVALCVFL